MSNKTTNNVYIIKNPNIYILQSFSQNPDNLSSSSVLFSFFKKTTTSCLHLYETAGIVFKKKKKKKTTLLCLALIPPLGPYPFIDSHSHAHINGMNQFDNIGG
jgi:hypothetical protein